MYKHFFSLGKLWDTCDLKKKLGRILTNKIFNLKKGTILKLNASYYQNYVYLSYVNIVFDIIFFKL